MRTEQQPIAIVGVSALFPGSTDATGFWRDILAGRDLLTDVPSTHWRIEDYYDADPSAPDKTYARRGGFLGNVDFDALGWGVPPSTLPATDTSQLLALVVAQAVLQDAAREQFESMDRSRMSVILGVTSAQELLFSLVSRLQRPVWVRALRESGLPEDQVQAACERIAANYVPWQEASFPGLLGNVVAGRIANRLNLGGTNCVTDAACASSFSALSMGVNELQLGHSDMVIAGGVDTLNDIFMYMCFSKTPALSPSGDCRPFSDQADGTMLGEGLGMVALKRLADAERDGDRVYAVVRGIGTGSDGRSKSVYAPVASGQARALQRAYDIAGYGPESVELMEAHGTGTKAGDAAEFEGLKQVFDAAQSRRQWCALGSVKSQIGHTKAAAGAAGLFKVVMALQHKVLPPTIKIDAPNPKLDIEQSPFYLNTSARPWIRGSAHPRRASVSAFGFGGSNFHVALEEYRGPAPHAERMPSHMSELVLLHGDTLAELRDAAAAMLADTRALAHVAADSRSRWNQNAQHRLALVVADVSQLQQRLGVALARIEAQPEQPFSLPDGSCYGSGEADGKLAVLFPGQGSQYLDMGAALAMQFNTARAVWDAAADLRLDNDLPLHEVVFPRPTFNAAARDANAARLTATEWAQPALAACSAAQWAVLQELGVEADMFAGHSFGELVALHAAGAYDLPTAMQLARRRGELMRDAAQRPGAMLALGQSIERVRELLSTHAADELVVANHNAPQQVVVSGPLQAIDAFEAKLQADGIGCKRLPVATAFHSSVVADAASGLADALKDASVSAPSLPVYANSSAAVYPKKAAAIRKQLAAQLAQPVRFVEMIEAMHADGARCFVEVGAGAVLGGLVGAILGDRPHTVVTLDRRGRDGVDTLLTGLARLAAAGFALRPEQLFADTRLPLPPVKSKLAVPVCGSNIGKPYPPLDPADWPAPNVPNVVADGRGFGAEQGSDERQPEDVKSPGSLRPNGTQPATLRSPGAVRPEVSKDEGRSPESHRVRSWFDTSPRTEGGLSGSESESNPTSVTSATHPALQPTAMNNDLSVSAAWLAAFQDHQQQTASAHTAFQRAMADSHSAYLDMASNSLAGLQAMLGGAPITADQTDLHPSAPSVGHTSIHHASMSPVVAGIAPVPSPTPAAQAPATAAAPADAPHAPPIPVLAVVAGPPSIDLAALLLDIVADKTGYPVDMLQLDMDLEGDLGVDSIKRVEILAAVDERAPQLPKVDRARLSALHTLREIVDYLQGAASTPAAMTPAAAPAGAALVTSSAPVANATPAAPTFDLPALLLDVVAEKTGYPVDMLQLDMDLEGDLGVDSIKRVEILAAVDERAPHLPKVDRARLSALHTLREIVDYLGAAVPAQPNAVASNATAASGAMKSSITNQSQPALNLGRFVVEAIAAPATGFALPCLVSGERVWVMGDEAYGTALVTALRARGANAHYTDALPKSAQACIHLGGLATPDTIDVAMAVNRTVFAVARQLAPRLQAGAGLFVTVQDSGGKFGLAASSDPASADTQPWLAGLPALVKTCALEWPQATLKAIDIERAGRSPAQVANAIADELLGGGGEIEIALDAAGGRSTLHCVARPAVKAEPVVEAGDVVVVSGGARGVTAACLQAWARHCRPQLVLLGRTPLSDEPAVCNGIDDEPGLKRVLLAAAKTAGESITPNELQARVDHVLSMREIRATLAAIAEAGGQAHYRAVSVEDVAALQETLADVRNTLGPIRGLIHAAGVLADRRIVDKTDAQFDRVFDTKVRGLHALLQATADDPLKLLCVFSSVSARCGNTGQADYAMANEVLAKVAQAEARRRPGMRVKSLAWGPWEGGMVTPQLKQRFAELGVPMIPLDIGAQMFVDELDDAGAVELVLGGEPRPEALLSEGADGRVEALELLVQRDSHAFLEGHAVNGQPVVPVVLMAEWLTRAARSLRPGLHVVAMQDLKVLKGIRLHGFENGGDRFRIEARALPGSSGRQLQMMVRDATGTPNYSARIVLGAAPATASEGLPPLQVDDWAGGPLYADLLFHRGQFELIETLNGISDHGIAAHVRGVHAAQWPGDSWQLDVAALDGGLQMAVLYGQRMLGGPNLPTSIGELRSFARPTVGPITVAAYQRASGNSATRTDILFADASGRRVAELIDVQNHAY